MALTPGKSPNLPKTKNLFLSPSLLSFSDKPPHFTPAQPPDGKSTVVFLCMPSVTTGVLGVYLRIMALDSRSLPLKWAAVCALGQIRLLPFLFRHSWYGRHVARSAQSFDVRRIFWWLDLICTARLVGLMFNACFYSSIPILLIGSNRIITTLFCRYSALGMGVCLIVAQSNIITSFCYPHVLIPSHTEIFAVGAALFQLFLVQ